MINIQRTNSGNPDFIQLIRLLDKHLSDVFGTIQEYYGQFNIISNNDTVVVAYMNEVPAGSGCIRQYDANTIEVKRMFVSEEYRGNGIAGAVLNELETWAKELGYKRIILETGNLLSAAIELYKKHGYRVTENYGPYVGKEASICMEKVLTNTAVNGTN
jgi:putative acetyltransferase